MKPSQLLISVLVVLVVLSIAIGVATMENDSPTALEPQKGSGLEVANSDGPMPKAVIDETSYEFGTMGVGKTMSHKFVVRNEGDAPLRLKKGESTCKCTVAELENEELAPGASVEIDLEWHPISPDPLFQQTAKIHTSDPNMTEISLTILGTVDSPIVPLPTSVWDLGEFNVEEESATIKTQLVSRQLEAFEITNAAPATPNIVCKWDAMTAGELEEQDFKSGYNVTVTVTAPFVVGPLESSVKFDIKAEGADDEEVNEVDVSINGIARGPLKLRPISPNGVWFQQRQLFSINSFTASDGTTAKYSVIARGLDDGKLEITGFEGPDNVEFKLTHQSRAFYWLEVTIKPGPSRLVGSNEPLKFKILTSHPTMPEWEVQLIYQAL